MIHLDAVAEMVRRDFELWGHAVRHYRETIKDSQKLKNEFKKMLDGLYEKPTPEELKRKIIYAYRQMEHLDFLRELYSGTLAVLTESLAACAQRFGLDFDPLFEIPHVLSKPELSKGEALAEKLHALAMEQLKKSASGDNKEIDKATPKLNTIEENVLGAIGSSTMRGEQVAKKAGYPFNSNFKTTLANMKRREILGNDGNGYFVRTRSGTESGQSRD